MNSPRINISLKHPKQVTIVVLLVVVISFGFFLGITHFSTNIKDAITKIYYADDISPAHQLVIDDFNEKYKGIIEVVPVDLPFIKFDTNLRKELLARSLRNRNSIIDVFAIDQVWNSRFSTWAEPLDNYLPGATLQSILPSIVTNCYCDSSLISIPLHTDVGVLYYRKDIIREMDPSGELERVLKESICWSDFIDLGLQYNKPHKFYTFQAYNYEGLLVNFIEILGPVKAKDIFNNHTQGIEPDLIQFGTDFLYKLIYTYKLSPPEVRTFNENRSYEYALNNDIPFFRGWPTYYQSLKGSPIQEKVGIAAPPHIEGQPPASVLGGWNLMISKHSKVKSEAALFLNYMLSPEVQKTMLLEGGYLPVLGNLYKDPEILNKMEYLPYLKHLLDQGFYRPSDKRYTYLSQQLVEQIHRELVQPTKSD